MKIDAAAITMDNAGTLVEAGLAAIARGDTVVDLSAVRSVDSSAVALLLAFYRAARAQGKTLALHGVPDALVSLARLYGVESLLALDGLPAPTR
ncbi:MAG: STAS domain-containing protein [Sutterellaceae bacterium]|nr:STAS domain-containing protein [Burkholderiaceae bacterium]MCX7901898.1 STAS domain-containing protein [Burkholderiaceae bacterium]MDW8430602.1 STAS domain-containing protein [Sutterellaceae bacterium]